MASLGGAERPAQNHPAPLPAKCPELNPQENVWQFMRDNWLSNRVFKSYDDILAHCCGGLGRAGMMAACLLVDEGVESDEAMASVRAVRPGAIETAPQENWVKRGRDA